MASHVVFTVNLLAIAANVAHRHAGILFTRASAVVIKVEDESRWFILTNHWCGSLSEGLWLGQGIGRFDSLLNDGLVAQALINGGPRVPLESDQHVFQHRSSSLLSPLTLISRSQRDQVFLFVVFKFNSFRYNFFNLTVCDVKKDNKTCTNRPSQKRGAKHIGQNFLLLRPLGAQRQER